MPDWSGCVVAGWKGVRWRNTCSFLLSGSWALKRVIPGLSTLLQLDGIDCRAVHVLSGVSEGLYTVRSRRNHPRRLAICQFPSDIVFGRCAGKGEAVTTNICIFFMYTLLAVYVFGIQTLWQALYLGPSSRVPPTLRTRKLPADLLEVPEEQRQVIGTCFFAHALLLLLPCHQLCNNKTTKYLFTTCVCWRAIIQNVHLLWKQGLPGSVVAKDTLQKTDKACTCLWCYTFFSPIWSSFTSYLQVGHQDLPEQHQVFQMGNLECHLELLKAQATKPLQLDCWLYIQRIDVRMRLQYFTSVE